MPVDRVRAIAQDRKCADAFQTKADYDNFEQSASLKTVLWPLADFGFQSSCKRRLFVQNVHFMSKVLFLMDFRDLQRSDDAGDPWESSTAQAMFNPAYVGKLGDQDRMRTGKLPSL